MSHLLVLPPLSINILTDYLHSTPKCLVEKTYTGKDVQVQNLPVQSFNILHLSRFGDFSLQMFIKCFFINVMGGKLGF